jgi:hypothetical protein
VGRRAGNESETAIAIDRSNPNNLVVVSNWDTAGMFRAFSTNAGATWTATSVASPAFSDSWLGSDSFGNIYLSYLNTTGGGNTTVARSTNGGQTFTTLATVGNSTFGTDHPEMGVGPGPTAGQQSVWLSHANFTGSAASAIQVFGATATALGNTSSFSTPQTLGSSSGGDFGSIAVGPGGRRRRS